MLSYRKIKVNVVKINAWHARMFLLFNLKNLARDLKKIRHPCIRVTHNYMWTRAPYSQLAAEYALLNK